MKQKVEELLGYIKTLCEADVERIINFVLGIVTTNKQMPDRPSCPYCAETHVIKYGLLKKRKKSAKEKKYRAN